MTTYYVKVLTDQSISISSGNDQDDEAVFLSADGQWHPVSDVLVATPGFQKLWMAGSLQVSTDPEGTHIITRVPDNTGRAYRDWSPEGGVTTLPRWGGLSAVPVTSGDLNLTYFYAETDLVVSTVAVVVNDTAASGLTLAKVGIYAVDESWDLTLVGASANTTNDFAGTFTTYTLPLMAPTQINAGKKYAVGALLAGTTMPHLTGSFTQDAANMWPRLCAKLSAQTDLPETITDALTSWNFIMFYADLQAAP